MIDLTFAVIDAQPERDAVVPTLKFRLQIREAAKRPVHGILLRCQLQIEPRRRRHAPAEQERLADLFGSPARWAETLRPLIWTQTSMTVPAFEGSVEIDLPVACTYDFEVTTAKYLHALEGGEAPLLLLFSGTVFAKADGGFLVSQIPWEKRAAFRMPVQTWRDLMDAYFPGCAWIRLSHEKLDALQRFRTRNALLNWDDAIDALLSASEAPVR
jgi:hypothetical protein